MQSRLYTEGRTIYFDDGLIKEVIGVIDAENQVWIKDELEGETLHHRSRLFNLDPENVMSVARRWMGELRFRRARRLQSL